MRYLVVFAVSCFVLAFIGIQAATSPRWAGESVYPDLPRIVLPLSDGQCVTGMTFNGVGRPVLYATSAGSDPRHFYAIQYSSVDGKTYQPQFVYVVRGDK
jgi:hypothetical protein